MSTIFEPNEPPQEKIFVELLIKMEGSDVSNRITVFELPIVGRIFSKDDPEESQVQFESKALVKAIKAAVDKLV